MVAALKRVSLSQGGVDLEVVPARGGLVTRACVRGRELLWLNPATVDDLGVSVRGGIPLLFPFAGPLLHNRFEDAGTTMARHGFARHLPWEGSLDSTAVTCWLRSTPATLAVYPYPFALHHRVTALPRGLECVFTVENQGARSMPISPGWHPYFPCPQAHKRRVTTAVPGLDPARFDPLLEFDFGVTAPLDGRAVFDIPHLGTLHLSHSPELRYLQCWSLPGQDFICLEPFHGPNNTINLPGRLEIPAGTTKSLFMRIELDF